MDKLLRSFWQEEDALGTVEMVLLLAVLVAIALIFKDAIVDWVTVTVEKVFGNATTVTDPPSPKK